MHLLAVEKSEAVKIFGSWEYPLAKAVMFVLMLAFFACVLYYTLKAKKASS